MPDNRPVWTKASVLRELKSHADPKVRAKMEYFGVRVPNAYGISAPVLHGLAKRIGKDHSLALELWTTGNHEARILATLIGEFETVTAAEMERWVRDFGTSWTRRAAIFMPKPDLRGVKSRHGASGVKNS